MAYPITPAWTKVRAAMRPWARLAERGSGWGEGMGAGEESTVRRERTVSTESLMPPSLITDSLELELNLLLRVYKYQARF